MGRFTLVFLVAGGVLAFLGFREYRLASHCKPEPTVITAAELERNGPPKDNAYIALEKHILCTQWFVYQKKSKSNPEWTAIYIPAVPAGGEFEQESILALLKDPSGSSLPKPKNIHIIVKSSHVSNESALKTFENKNRIQGLLVNEIQSLGAKEKEILSQNYPNIDFGKCYILEEGRTAMSAGMTGGMMGGGVGLFLLGAFLGVKKIKG